MNTAPYFGAGGTGVIYQPLASNTWFRELLVQADGRIVAVGSVTLTGPTNLNLLVARYLPDGTLDPGFGGGGVVSLGIPGSSESAYAVALQTDGKVLVTGLATGLSPSTSRDLLTVRLNPDGTLDDAFGNGGQVLTSFGTGSHQSNAVVVQADGQILIAGRADPAVGVSGGGRVVRYNTDGSLDTGFGNNGSVNVMLSQLSGGEFRDLVVQPDGRILLLGWHFADAKNTLVMVRLESNGALDPSFGNGGMFTVAPYSTAIGSYSGEIQGNSVVLTSGGKFLVDARLGTSSGVLRFNADGSLDTAFGDGGLARVPQLPGGVYSVDLALQSDGRIVVASSGTQDYGIDATPRYSQEWVVSRLNANGSLDTSFGLGGSVVTPGRDVEFAEAVLTQADGKILLVGTSGLPYQASIVRYNADGTLDRSFGGSGGLDGTPTWTQGTAPVVLDADVRIYDAELQAGDSFAGASLVLVRRGGPVASDAYSATGTLGPLTQGAALVVGGVTVGTVVANGGGRLELLFGANATQARVDAVLQQIAYSNTAASPPASVTLDWVFSDGDPGGALAASGSTLVTLVSVPDPTAPNPPLIARVTDDFGPLTGIVPAGGATDDRLPTLAGTAVPGSTVRIFLGAVELGSTTANGVGAWSFTPTQLLAPGELVFTATATDAQGNASAASAAYLVSLINVIVGTPGPDVLNGIAGLDSVTGLAGNDTIRGGAGNDTIDGGAGIDVAVFEIPRAQATINAQSVQAPLAATVAAGALGTDTLAHVERLAFSDLWYALDILPSGNVDDPLTKGEGGNAGKAYRIYQAAFDRTPDLPGLGYWIHQIDAGNSLFDIATGFLISDEFQTLYGVNPTSAEYTRALYLNVLDREPDAAGYAYWTAVLDGGLTTRQQMLVDFSESAENKANLAPIIGSGFVYEPWIV